MELRQSTRRARDSRRKPPRTRDRYRTLLNPDTCPPANPVAIAHHQARRRNRRLVDDHAVIAARVPAQQHVHRHDMRPESRRLGGNRVASVTDVTYLQVSGAVSLASVLDAERVHGPHPGCTPPLGRSVWRPARAFVRAGRTRPTCCVNRRGAERREPVLARQVHRDIEVVMTTEEVIIKSDRPLLPLLSAVEKAGGSILLLERGGRRARLARLVLPQDPCRAARCRELIDDWTSAGGWPLGHPRHQHY